MWSNNKGEFSPSVVIFLTVLVLILFTGGFFVVKMQVERKYSNSLQLTPESMDDLDSAVSEPTIVQESPQSTASAQKKPVVVYIPAGNFTDVEKTELELKLVNPLTDWNIEQKRPAVSISVEKYQEPVAGYVYKVNYINEDGTNGGLLFGAISPLEWWLPECMDGCNLSPEFVAKYPEIAKQVE